MRADYDGLNTSFDVFPAYAPPSHLKDSNTVQYVFRFLRPKDWPGPAEKRWVLWDFTRQCVTLTSTLQDYCFPRLVEDSQAPHPFWIKLEKSDHKHNLVELNLDAADLTKADIAMGDLDTPGVSFGKGRKRRLNVGIPASRFIYRIVAFTDNFTLDQPFSIGMSAGFLARWCLYFKDRIHDRILFVVYLYCPNAQSLCLKGISKGNMITCQT